VPNRGARLPSGSGVEAVLGPTVRHGPPWGRRLRWFLGLPLRHVTVGRRPGAWTAQSFAGGLPGPSRGYADRESIGRHLPEGSSPKKKTAYLCRRLYPTMPSGPGRHWDALRPRLRLRLPSGDPLSPRRFQQLGMAFWRPAGRLRAGALPAGKTPLYVSGSRAGQKFSYGFLRAGGGRAAL